MSPNEFRQSLVPDEPLFRREVLAGRQSQWLGPVLLEPRISHRLYAWTAGIAIATILLLLVVGNYTRKARITGWLMPEAGMIRVFAPQPGVVAQIKVSEGRSVKQGEPLLVLSGEIHSDPDTATKTEVVNRLQDRRDSLNTDLQTQQQLFAQQRIELSNRLAAIGDSQLHVTRELALLQKRVQLAGQTLRRGQALRSQDLISMVRFEQIEQDSLDLETKLETVRREQSTLAQDRAVTEGALQQLPLRRETQLGTIKRDVFSVEQQLAEAESQRQVVITAPQDGVVTGIQTETGGSVSLNTPLMSVVPSDHVLEALLYGPSRAIGFVHAGQHVLLRYQAYPYQKFGVHDGVVTSVSKTAVNPAEFTQQLSGLAAVYGPTEPLYRISVQLKKQTVLAYGVETPLQPGMQLDADVMIDNRRLIEWIFDPLFTITGTWR